MQQKTLRERILRAGSTTLIGHASGQVLRLLSNLVLARMLYPEAFGTMAIVQTVLTGVMLLTDMGLSMSVMRSRHGDDPNFLNTIWTLQILKGAVVTLAMALLAQPIGAIYAHNQLPEMLVAIGVAAWIGAFKSTRIDVALRHMRAGRVVAVELASQAFQLAFTVAMAWLLKSPWTLVWGNLAYAACYTGLSHAALPGARNRLAWSRSAVDEVWRFSGWVMLGSTVTYVTGEGLNLLRARLMSLEFMGQWSIANTLALMSWNAIQRVTGQVIFPAYAETLREQPERLVARVKKSRRLQLLLGWTSSVFLVLTGPWLIGMLYDSRYQTAGLMMQVAATGLVLSLMGTSYGGVLEAMGHPRLSTSLQAGQGLLRATGLWLGGRYFGEWGVVVANVAVNALVCPIQAWVYGSFGFRDAAFDTLGVALAAALLTLLYLRLI